MYVSQKRLPHLLDPAAYYQQEQFERECATLMKTGWHVVGTTEELSQPGDFITCELFGEEVYVRNFDGELRAFSNVCAHRHCLIESRSCGSSQTMRCPYHGWEYTANGQTGRIPSPQNFVPFTSKGESLTRFRLATCGQLVFVSLSTSGISLQDFLGDFYTVLDERFGNSWKPFLFFGPASSANWKVLVENTLEAYHVPCVHPKTFRCDPGAERSRHELGSQRTSLRTQLPFSPHSLLDSQFQKFEGRLLKWLGCDVTASYEQHHVFPNLLFSFTDTISLCQCVIPTGPTSCRSIIRQFGIADAGTGRAKWIFSAWGKLTAWITKRVVKEDAKLVPQIQRGLESSRQAGILGICEERIHSFQQYLTRVLNESCSVNQTFPCSAGATDIEREVSA